MFGQESRIEHALCKTLMRSELIAVYTQAIPFQPSVFLVIPANGKNLLKRTTYLLLAS